MYVEIKVLYWLLTYLKNRNLIALGAVWFHVMNMIWFFSVYHFIVFYKHAVNDIHLSDIYTSYFWLLHYNKTN